MTSSRFLPLLRPLLLAALLILPFVGGCADSDETADNFKADREWAAIENEARSTTVRFYMWGGSATVNEWIDGYVTEEMEKRHDITVKRVAMDAPVFINKLLTEKAAGRTTGTIDLLWINGENFRSAKEAGLLYGPFSENLPNFKQYVNPSSAASDFGYPVEGFEAPYGRAQFVFEYDSARTATPPASFEQLAQWVRDNPGRFTYPQPPNFTGSAFIRQAFYAVTGGHQQYMNGFDQELYDRNAPRLWAYLNDLKPYLWQEGRAYPKDSATLDTLFARGEVDFSMAYHPPHAQNMILDGSYPDTVRTFVMSEGSIYNTHFTAIPVTAPNKAGAMVLANFLLSPEAQFSKYRPENWGDFPVLDLTLLPVEERKRFLTVDMGNATLPPDILAESAVPEIPSDYLEALERDWDRYVLRENQN